MMYFIREESQRDLQSKSRQKGVSYSKRLVKKAGSGHKAEISSSLERNVFILHGSTVFDRLR